MSRRFIIGTLTTAVLITAISAAAPVRASGFPALERFFGAAAGLFAISHILGFSDGAEASSGDIATAPAASEHNSVNPHRRAGPYWAPEQTTWREARG
ncbi:hypothetical protein [Citreimonas salinaria]|uniref:Uncharacterized protein n=1 Tax=Citreimonas salinaria TaxID=321339 RepID=A0A1H3HSW5_9RHOB|nr:hypothetical protein [Citreimonas salinaria]SDY18563.1 hypothetical protein SAMN05444340_104147 [Citreimonas salinaria]